MDWNTTTLEDLKQSDAAMISKSAAASVLNIDPRTLTKAIDDGTIPAIRIGRKVLIPREKFLAMFDVERQDIAA